MDGHQIASDSEEVDYLSSPDINPGGAEGIKAPQIEGPSVGIMPKSEARIGPRLEPPPESNQRDLTKARDELQALKTQSLDDPAATARMMADNEKVVKKEVVVVHDQPANNQEPWESVINVAAGVGRIAVRAVGAVASLVTGGKR